MKIIYDGNTAMHMIGLYAEDGAFLRSRLREPLGEESLMDHCCLSREFESYISEIDHEAQYGQSSLL